MQYLKYFFGGKVMGCFGGGKSSGGFGCEWLIVLAIIFFCCCNGSNGFGCFSDLFEDCDWLIWLAIILLLLYLCNCSDECCD